MKDLDHVPDLEDNGDHQCIFNITRTLARCETCGKEYKL